jgi:hypothetical protein
MFHHVGDYATGCGDTITTTANSETGMAFTDGDAIVYTDEWQATASSTDGLAFEYTATGSETWAWETANNASATIDWDLSLPTPEEWARQEKARERARTLLERHLTPKQWLDYEEFGHFFIKTPKGHRYQIGSAHYQNVVRLNKRRKAMRTLCVVVRDVNVPVEDLMLAQKLMLETQEDAFLKIAHHWGVASARGLRRAA